jgi:Tfp pilus assembly protein PilO
VSGPAGWIARAAAGALVFGAVVATHRLTLYSKDVAARETAEREVAALTERLRQMEAAAADQAKLGDDLRRLEAEDASLEKVVPRETAEQVLVKTFDWRARELGLAITGLRWGARQTREGYTAAPLTLEVRGAPGAALLFGARVTTGDPLLAIQSIELRRGPLSTLQVTAEALAVPGT